jgi:hypothetical protein
MSIVPVINHKEKHSMDWKEGAKWVGILVFAGVISAGIEIALQNWLTGQAKAAAKTEARAEVDRVMTAALQQMNTQRASNSPKLVGDQPTVPRQSDQRGYSYQF